MKDGKYEGHRLLIISNNVLSKTRSNGKTVMSYFDCLSCDSIRQLYFSTELPSIPGYSYFQIADKDIIRGIIDPSKRGRAVAEVKEDNFKSYKQNPGSIKKPFFRLAREVLWSGKWKSKQLLAWLDDYKPTDIFFVGGDCLFAFKIAEYVRQRYSARFSMFLTDDYIMPRKHESAVSKYRRKLIRNSLKKAIDHTDQLFTISAPMRKQYKALFGKDSELAVNMSPCLKDHSIEPYQDQTVLMYAGSLYYGRDEVLGKIAEAIAKYNDHADKKALLKIYTNLPPEENILKKIHIEGASEYCGSLTNEELIKELNRSNILCIVESFEEEHMDSTRFSLSTKVSEYLSAEKPVLAVGPAGIGTIDYLQDAAFCITEQEMIDSRLKELLSSEELQKKYSEIAYKKYVQNHTKESIQIPFINKVFGIGQ